MMRGTMTTLLGAAMMLAGCSSHVAVRGTAPGVAGTYTQVNLRADQRGRIVSVNYQANALVPVCTPVRIDRIRGREIRFTNLQNGARYQFIRHRASRMPIEQHAQRLFGGGCPDIGAMSDADQAGIANGEVYQGMSRQGVVMAMGFPPEHRTASTAGQDVWTYWRTNMHSIEVYFTNDQVTGLRDPRQERADARQQRRADRRAARAEARAVRVEAREAQIEAAADARVEVQTAPVTVDVHSPPPPPPGATVTVQGNAGGVRVEARAPGAAFTARYDAAYGDVPSCEAEVINAGHGGGATVHCGDAEPYCAAAMMRLGHAPAHLVHCGGVDPECAVTHLESGGAPAGLVHCR